MKVFLDLNIYNLEMKGRLKRAYTKPNRRSTIYEGSFKDRFRLEFFPQDLPEDFLRSLKETIKEPIKFLKDPMLNTLAIDSIKNPNIELFVETYCYTYRIHTFHRLTKDSYEEISREIFTNEFKKFIGEI